MEHKSGPFCSYQIGKSTRHDGGMSSRHNRTILVDSADVSPPTMSNSNFVKLLGCTFDLNMDCASLDIDNKCSSSEGLCRLI